MTAKLLWQDYIVIAATMFISIGIGIYYRFSGGRQKTTLEYFSANKSMGVLPVAIALMVSFMSAITLLGVSAENYTYGTQFVVINIAYLIGTPIICYGFLPVFYNLGAVSAYEYLEKRFGYSARVAASFASWVQLLLYSGVVLYAPSLALEATTGLDRKYSIIIIGLVCAFYSTIGGIKAVLITDVFQGVLMFASLFIVIISAAIRVGGLGEIWKIAQEGGRLEFNNISFDPTVRHTWWGLIIGGLFTFLSLFGVNQVQVQRMMTLKTMKSSRTALWLNWPILTCLSIVTCFSGLAIYSHYYKCDPREDGRIKSPDMLMPLYIMDTLSKFPGIPGLFVAGIFSAGLSTISAGLNSLAVVTLEDYIKPIYTKVTGNEFSEPKSLVFSKLLVLTFGIACIALAFAAELLGTGVLQASLTIFGVVGGPLLGIFTLGMAVESANEVGAVTGLLTAMTFCLWISFGQPRPPIPTLPVSTENCALKREIATILQASLPMSEKLVAAPPPESFFYLYRISYIWYSVIGFAITIIVGILVSYIIRATHGNFNDELDPELFFPVIAKRIRKRRQARNALNGNLEPNNLYVFDGKYQESVRDKNAKIYL
ncbi:putative sodium-dependent multivitamin transporter [Trichogramma pretiosum]|uniref:putative sodium-dependent multivitamin transporter n=1 Tax=Trichogramma pretiosum TaxID=7493 RepID=UPI0006C98202|nr:putative sodium-dependent multivitamin transporter [Trichogramma pretiosum]